MPRPDSWSQRRRSILAGTALGPRTFYAKDMARKDKAGQDTPLPPRCVHCRLPGTLMRDGMPHCPGHVPCDLTCGMQVACVSRGCGARIHHDGYRWVHSVTGNLRCDVVEGGRVPTYAHPDEDLLRPDLG